MHLQGGVSPDTNNESAATNHGLATAAMLDGDATRAAHDDAHNAGGGRSRVRRRPPIPPSGPAHEEHGHPARMPRVRRDNELPRGAHRHQKGEGGENASGERAAGVRPPPRRPPRDHRRRGCQKLRRGAPKLNSTWAIPRRPGFRTSLPKKRESQSSLLILHLPYRWCTCGLMVGVACARAQERAGYGKANCDARVRTSLLDPFDARWPAG